MAEFILKTNLPPPNGWEYTGEYRYVKSGEFYPSGSIAAQWKRSYQLAAPYPILRRKRWVPKPGEEYWYANNLGVRSTINMERWCDETNLEDGNCWRTEEQAIAYAKACRKLAVKMQDEVQDN